MRPVIERDGRLTSLAAVMPSAGLLARSRGQLGTDKYPVLSGPPGATLLLLLSAHRCRSCWVIRKRKAPSRNLTGLACHQGRGSVQRFGYVPSLGMAAAHLSKINRLLHTIDDWTSKAWIAGTLSIASVLALVAAFVTGLSSPTVTVVTAVIQVVTLVLIFAVQHTQARDQKATHRKLDELLATIPATDRRFIRLEQATDDEINNSLHSHSERRANE